jgi:hypothetical protein
MKNKRIEIEKQIQYLDNKWMTMVDVAHRQVDEVNKELLLNAASIIKADMCELSLELAEIEVDEKIHHL